MQYLNIPEKRLSIFDKQHDFEINSDLGRIDNTSEMSLTNQRQEILSEKNESCDKEVNVREIVEKLRSLNAEERSFIQNPSKFFYCSSPNIKFPNF